MTLATTWMNLKGIMLNERNQSQKAERQNCSDGEQISDYQGRMCLKGDFRGYGTVLYPNYDGKYMNLYIC